MVLFPGTRVPLHIFEPRYKAMLMHCLEQGPAAMVLGMLREGQEGEPPPVYEVAGAGRIESWEQLANGNYALVIHGVQRIRIARELEAEAPFRLVEARLVEDEDAREVRADTQALMACTAQVVRHIQDVHDDFQLDLDHGLPPSQLADQIADRLIGEAPVRQALLETASVQERVRKLTGAVGELLAVLTRQAAPRRPSSAN